MSAGSRISHNCNLVCIPFTTHKPFGSPGQIQRITKQDLMAWRQTLTEAGYGVPTQGSRIVAWGWNPVGFYNPLKLPFQTNFLVAAGQVGTVTVTTS
jgi:hypothetical protein